VTPYERQYVGKSTHSLNYDVGPMTLCEFVNKRGLESGIFISLAFAKMVKKMYTKKYKAVNAWKDWVWKLGKATKTLTNFVGRRRIFLGPTIGPRAVDTRGEMIAFRPQSTVPDMLSMAMWKIYNDPLCQEHGVELLNQVHDAVLVQGNAATKDIWAPRVAELMVIPLEIHGRKCVVPVDYALGKKWSECK
jgi:DNA polymerase I-like protein with 3'-5' exonuclease and polymerase domains